MESSDTREPSYYEVALTNRQVLVAFVVILATLLGAFLSGVWIGRGGSPARSASSAAPATEKGPDAEPVEQLTFFAEEPESAGAASAAEPGAKGDSATETMRKTLEAEMAANREAAAPATKAATEPAPKPAAADVPSAPGSRTRRRPQAEKAGAGAAATPKPAPTPETAPPAAPKPAAEATAGATWVQVYSSTNGERAREIAAQLRRAGFEVVVAELPRKAKPNWRVRVGPFTTREAAESAATRLRREHSLDTWVTDSP